MNRLWRSVRFTVGWTVTAADETAIGQVPVNAWSDSLNQDRTVTDDAHVAELTGLNTRLAGWTGTLRLLVRRTKPSARHRKNLTALEKRTGRRYQIVARSRCQRSTVSGRTTGRS